MNEETTERWYRKLPERVKTEANLSQTMRELMLPMEKWLMDREEEQERNAVLEKIVQLLGCSIEEASEIFTYCACRIQGLRDAGLDDDKIKELLE